MSRFRLSEKAAKEIDNLFLETVFLCFVLPVSLVCNVLLVILLAFYR